MKIHSIFKSIQGEGVCTGVPMVFVRLQGCNLFPGSCCSYCDTVDAQDPNKVPMELTPQQVFEEVYKYKPCWWICITGGEPLLQQQELRELVKLLQGAGYKTEVETNGTLPLPDWSSWVHSWVVDIKCPSSGNPLGMHQNWISLRPQDQLKFVVRESDLDFVRRYLRILLLGRTIGLDTPEILISPIYPFVRGSSDLESCIKFCLDNNIRLSPQVHKMIGVQ